MMTNIARAWIYCQNMDMWNATGSSLLAHNRAGTATIDGTEGILKASADCLGGFGHVGDGCDLN
jgi:hypothetical protein